MPDRTDAERLRDLADRIDAAPALPDGITVDRCPLCRGDGCHDCTRGLVLRDDRLDAAPADPEPYADGPLAEGLRFCVENCTFIGSTERERLRRGLHALLAADPDPDPSTPPAAPLERAGDAATGVDAVAEAARLCAELGRVRLELGTWPRVGGWTASAVEVLGGPHRHLRAIGEGPTPADACRALVAALTADGGTTEPGRDHLAADCPCRACTEASAREFTAEHADTLALLAKGEADADPCPRCGLGRDECERLWAPGDAGHGDGGRVGTGEAG